MVALRRRLTGAELAPLGLAAFFFVVAVTRSGHQDLAALMAQQPAVSERARQHVLAAPLATLNAATFGFPHSFGAGMESAPRPTPARFEVAGSDITGAISDADARAREIVPGEAKPLPSVNRKLKGDRLVPLHNPEPAPAPPAEPAQESVELDIVSELLRPPPAVDTTETDELEAAVHYKPFPEYDISLSLELRPKVPAEAAEGPGSDTIASEDTTADSPEAQTMFGASRLYFDAAPMSASLAAIEPWAAGEAPVLIVPPAPVVAALPAGGSRLAADGGDARRETSADTVTIARKGEVTGEGRQPMSPAEHLRLDGKPRAKAERCLSNAVYFEARSESVRGQIAVAQVVLNRAFSGYYPQDVCGVVYQGANRHLSCQFTFACDGIPDVVTDQESWDRAKRIAKASLDGKVWLNEIGKATHYHANYVNPYWVRSMRRLHKIGVHSFYRPRRWGNGVDELSWGTPANVAMAAKL